MAPETGASVSQASVIRTSTGAVLVTTGGLVAVFVTSALAPELARDADVTPSRLGLAVAVFFATGAFAAPVGGRLADRFGSVRVMRASLGLAAASLLAIGVLVDGWVGLVVALGVAGVSNGAIQPSANRYVSRLTPRNRQGLAFGIKQSAIPAAMLLGGVSVPVAAYFTGWRAVFIVCAVVAVALGWTVRVPAPARGRSRDGGHVPLPSAARRALLVVAVGWALASSGANGLGSFLVLGAVHDGFSHVAAGVLLVVGSMFSIAARVLVGLLADRSDRVGFSLAGLMAVAGGVGLCLLATGTMWAYVLIPLLGYALGWGWPGLVNYLVVRAYPDKPGQSTGLIQAGASTGACLGPLAFGVIVDYSGYPVAWLLAGVSLLLSSVLIAGARRLLPPVGARAGEGT
ncbi:MAG: MFS transporter [Actinomycetes bacterium]